jgi:hypothetical protein
MWIVDAALVTAGIGGWLLAYGGVWLATRPASPSPGPATPDLGTESPAVVSLLANRWDLTEDATEATLLDLAGRRHLELRQPGDDPMQTTIHLREAATGLKPYEQRVADRVGAVAVGGVVPVTALTFRDADQAKRWTRRLRAEVVAEARSLGLSRRRFGSAAVAALVAVAAVAATLVAVAAARYGMRSADDDVVGTVIVAWLFTFVLLAGLSSRYPGERDTPAGRTAAARWLGVRDWLRRHEEFANLPPASTTVWDRYLAYGVALGVTRVASAVLDLGMGNRRLVWSSYGGTWHRVRVRYPRFWSRYGRPARHLVRGSLLALGSGAVLVGYRAKPRQWLDGLAEARWFDVAERVALVAGVVLLAYGGYRLVRTLVDLATERTITGEVLWLEVWRSTSGGEDAPPRPFLHYLAVDDGSADRTTAWALPSDLRWGCHDGDTVTMRVRRWTRRVLTVTVVEHSRRRDTGDSAADELAAEVFGGAKTALRAPAVAIDTVLTPDEVGHALGIPVRAPEVTPVPGPLKSAFFATAEKNRPVLIIQLAEGTTAKLAWRMNKRGPVLPGVGDEAYASGDRATLRCGETIVLLTLVGRAKGKRDYLPWLLTRAAERLTG